MRDYIAWSNAELSAFFFPHTPMRDFMASSKADGKFKNNCFATCKM